MPQLSLILGPCAGGAVYCPALTDLIIMTRENSNMFVTGPDVVKAATGEVISMDDLGGGYVHNATSGVAHYLGEDEADAIDYARTVLAYLPSNSDQQPPVYAYAATRADRDVAKRLATIVPDNDRQPYDVLDVIRCIVDYGEFVQVHELFAASAVVGFACIDGHPVGIVANQPNVTPAFSRRLIRKKVARFVRLCDAFNLPVVTLVDTPGYKPGAEQEHAGIIRRGAKVIYAYANAQVPLVTIILRKAFGGAYIVMGSKSIGADMNFAWPSSQIAVLGAAGAVNIIHRKDLQKAKDNGKDVEALRAKYIADYERTTVNANLSLEMGEIDAMIDPEQTRETIIESLRLLASKKTRAPNQQTPRQPAAVTDATRRNQRKQPQQSQEILEQVRKIMNTFFLDRLNSEPHALAFAGQSTPWPVALADQSANPALDEALHTHAAARAGAAVSGVRRAARHHRTPGRPVRLRTEPGTSGRRSRGFRQRSRHRADPAGRAARRRRTRLQSGPGQAGRGARPLPGRACRAYGAGDLRSRFHRRSRSQDRRDSCDRNS